MPPTNSGNAAAYVGGRGHRPVPTVQPGARPLHTHREREKKPTGLDWGALRPKCTGCGQPSTELHDGLCPTCRPAPAKPRPTTAAAATHGELPPEDIERRFTGDTTRLGRDLADLEHTDPAVAAAAADLDQATDRITRPEDHAAAPASSDLDARALGDVALEAGRANDTARQNLDAQVAHVERLLRRTHGATNAATRLLRCNAIGALEALHLWCELNPDTLPAPSPRAGRGGPQTPAADPEGEAGRSPTPTPRPPAGSSVRQRTKRRGGGGKLAGHEDTIVQRYQNGETSRGLAPEFSVTPAAILHLLRRRGVAIRPRGSRPLRDTNPATPEGATR